MATRRTARDVLVLAAWAALVTASSVAAQPEVISTAPGPVQQGVAMATPVATGAQISAWEHDDRKDLSEANAADPLARASPRAVHGEVTAGIGSNGYREASGVVDLPVGETGDLIVAGSRSSFDGRGIGAGRQSLSVGLFLNGATPCVLDRQGLDLGNGDPSPTAWASPDRRSPVTRCSAQQVRSGPP